MKQIRIFEGIDDYGLADERKVEEYVNNWLWANDDKINLIDIKLIIDDHNRLYAIIIYDVVKSEIEELA